MANEIQASFNLTSTKGSATQQFQYSTSRDQSGSSSIKNVQSVGLSTEALLVGDTGATLGYFAVINRDATNFVVLSIDNASANIFAKLSPGDFAIMKGAASTTYYAKADTGACLVEYLLLPP